MVALEPLFPARRNRHPWVARNQRASEARPCQVHNTSATHFLKALAAREIGHKAEGVGRNRMVL